MRAARVIACVAVAAALPTAGCFGGGDDDDPPEAAARDALPAAQAQPPAPTTAGTLAQVADVGPARERLAFVNLAAVAGAPVGRAALLDRVLGPGARAAGAREAGTVVRVGDAATVLHGDDGAPVVRGADGALARALADPRPATSAIAPDAPSAAQACLGETIAQTVLGPGTMGRDAALGAGLAEGDELRIAALRAPRLIRQIHATERALERRFRGTGATVARGRDRRARDRRGEGPGRRALRACAARPPGRGRAAARARRALSHNPATPGAPRPVKLPRVNHVWELS